MDLYYRREPQDYIVRTLPGLSGGVLAYILQLQTAFIIIGIGVTFRAILCVSVAIMRLPCSSPKSSNEPDTADRGADTAKFVTPIG